MPDAEAANGPLPENVPPTVHREPPAHIPAPRMAVPPPRKFPAPREIFDPIQPIDLLPFAAQAGGRNSDRPLADTIREMRSLLEKKKASFQPQTPSTVCLADVPARGVEWLWPGRVPIGKITLLVGDPGVGKSLIALDIAARVTRGMPFPDPQNPEPRTLNPPSSVLLLSAEDDLADTIRPRLEALDADCTRVIALAAQPPTSAHQASASSPLTPDSRFPTPSILDLGRDVALLDRLLDSRPDCSLVIIDPISAYLGRAVENVNAEVRRIIAPLAELAARRRLALLVISHLRKQPGAAIHRSMGSLAFVAAARTAWLVCKDSPTKAGYTLERRLLLPIKNNIAVDATGLACTIESHPYAGLPIVCWSTDPIDVDADAALLGAQGSAGRPANDRDEAARWLEAQLAGGPRPAAEVKELASAHGFNQDTHHRAFRHLGGRAVRAGFGPGGQWSWSLPGKQAP